jgi:hypothetical protein
MAVELTAPAGEQTRARYPDASGYVEREGVRVFYAVCGDGEPTFLLLPTRSIARGERGGGPETSTTPRSRPTARRGRPPTLIAELL